MNKMILIILLFVSSYSHGINLEIINSVVLDTSGLDDFDYTATFGIYKYGISSGMAFSDEYQLLFFPLISKETSKSQGIMTSSSPNKAQLLAVFDNEGNYVNSIGQFNSFANGGIIDISCIKITNDILYVYDSVTKRVSAFRIAPDEFPFLYSIDTSGMFYSYSFYIKEGMFLGSKPSSYLRENDNAGFIAKIVYDERYPQSRSLDLLDTIMPSTAYRNFISYDYKRTLEILDRDEEYIKQNPNVKYLWESIATGGIYDTVLYELYNEHIFAVNTFGTDVFIFDNNYSVVDSIKIEDFQRFREEEKQIYDKLESRNVQSITDRYSKLHSIIINEKMELIVLYYCHSSTIAEMKGYDKFLFIYSLKNNRFVEAFYPIDFIPVSSFEDIVVGLNMDEEELCLEFYQLEE
jgi:hypothetical protein